MRDMTGQPAGLDFDENSDWLHTNNSYVRGTPQHEGTASKLTVLSQDRAVYGDSIAVLTNAESQDDPGSESVPSSPSANNNNKQRKRERERARYAAMSQEEKNAKNLRRRVVRQKNKEYQSPMEINDSQDRAPFGDLTNYTNEGADSESNLQPATNSTVQRKRERERTRYAAMSQEEKNAKNMRRREARQKKKGVARISFLRCYK
ncbi:uncharacterized protein LOC120706760 isoform X2 [Panicum virgatum]|uniref:Uncharacterized protein n=1 Tax=Panicum virgatum TaxID=38727 RepID=A0A8T0SGB8_PANVG|nr:uncharacterized protein LOC120706760 isoform X2 [Panicum virgatum]KAG2597297.1 hypothetical protein PVAP13_5KG267200 [Panicum virgatum]